MIYENIILLRPYFLSLREIGSNVSLDIKVPLTWKYENITKLYSALDIKIQDKNDKFTLLSLITESTIGGYELVFTCANEIITVNKEEEEKQKLFKEKVKELELLFKKQSLNKLKEINFIENYGQEDTTGIRMVEQGDEEGRGGDTEQQTTID